MTEATVRVKARRPFSRRRVQIGLPSAEYDTGVRSLGVAASLSPGRKQENNMDKAVATQLANIEKRTGKPLTDLAQIISSSGLTKHSELVAMLKREMGMGHGDANLLVHHVLKSDGQSAAEAAGADIDTIVNEIYTGTRTALRPIHDALMSAIERFGPFEIAPKKGYISLRRKKQFAMIGLATSSRVEVGLNMKEATGTARLEAQKPGGMCQFKVKVTEPSQVDAELVGWIRNAYDGAA
jgi:hypothetical protein